MLRSMTGYGKAELHHEAGRFSVEINCVNKRFLEVQIQLPRAFLSLESFLKKEVSKKLFRGQVQLVFSAFLEGESPLHVVANLPFLQSFKKAWEDASDHLGQKEAPFPLESFLQSKDFFFYEEESLDWERYKQPFSLVLEEALTQLISMREREGTETLQDLLGYLDEIAEHYSCIQERSPQACERYKKRLTETLESFGALQEQEEERVLKELALFADKVDISEELQRFSYHMTAIRELLISPKVGTKGRKLEFYLQELSREINTMGAKSSDAMISKEVIAIKSLLEKFREQVQNVE